MKIRAILYLSSLVSLDAIIWVMEVVEWDVKPVVRRNTYLFGRITGIVVEYRPGIVPGFGGDLIPNGVGISVVMQSDRYATLAWLGKVDDPTLTSDKMEKEAGLYNYLLGRYAKVQRRRESEDRRLSTKVVQLYTTPRPAVIDLVNLNIFAHQHPAYGISVYPQIEQAVPALSV